MTLPDPRVAVVVPVWNGAATLDATLCSVRAQSLREIEICVVDDGSTDASRAIALSHAADDVRIRVLTIPNSGVAAARNAGIAATTAPFVAPVDADDLWTCDWLALAMERFASAADGCVLVYGGYAAIDAGNRTLRTVIAGPEGDVRGAIAARNFVGNGSGAVMRRAAVAAAGGYDPALRKAGAQGCEDHMIYFGLALQGTFAAVRAATIGYRQTPGAMSRDHAQMARSHALCAAQFRRLWPDGKDAIDAGERAYRNWIVGRAIEDGGLSALPALWSAAWRDSPAATARTAMTALARSARSGAQRLIGRGVGERFDPARPAGKDVRCVNLSA